MVFKYHGVNGLMGFTEDDIYEKGQQGQRGKKGFVIALSMVNPCSCLYSRVCSTRVEVGGDV